MRIHRIKYIQKRAKRRFVLMAIGASVLVAYGSVTLFATDDKPIKPSVNELGKVPAVKAVGIRLVNANGKAVSDQPARTDLAASSPSLLAPPSLPAPIISSGSSSLELPPPMPSLPSSSAPSLPLPMPSLPTSSFVPAPALQPPPPMSEVTKSPNGRVVVKLSQDTNQPTATPRKVSESITDTAASARSQPSNEQVDIRVLPPLPVGQTTTMPPVVFEKSHPIASLPIDEASSTPASSGANSVRISLADSAAQEAAVTAPPALPNMIPIAGSGNAAKSRAPSIVKPKPTQVSHTVVLAQSAEFHTDELPVDPPSIESSPEPAAPITTRVGDEGPAVSVSLNEDTVTVTTVPEKPSKPLVAIPQPIKAPSSKTIAVAPSATEIDLTPVTAIPPAKPAREVAHRNAQRTSTAKFDPRHAQAPIATIELECMSATTMELPTHVKAVAIQNEDVCKVLQKDSSLSIIGNGEGSTIVQIWTAESDGKPQCVRVNVAQPWAKSSAKQNSIQDVARIIEQGFPNAVVKISTTEDGTVEVRGTADSEESARRILELIRKLCLVPVKDKLSVSR